tara:strand:+ start:571 stop:1164 length:594 start_codon:yes stop_codon:yes gene_type:complete
MTAFSEAWALLKMPLYEISDTGRERDGREWQQWNMNEGEENRQHQKNAFFPDLMGDENTNGVPFAPNIGMGDKMWISQDDMARGAASLDYDTGQLRIHHFEMGTPVRGQGQSEKYLKEMIDELTRHAHEDDEDINVNAHATRVEQYTADFWDKMVNRGLIHSASRRSNPRVTPDGKHFAPLIGSDKLKPTSLFGGME